MQTITAAASVATLATQKVALTSTADFVDVIEGILEGAVDAEGLDNIEHCVADVSKGIQDAEKTYGDCQEKSVFARAKCVADMGTLVGDVKTLVSDCESVKADWEKVEEMEKIFASPTSFEFNVVKDVILNHAEIGTDIENAVASYKSSDWKSFGLNIGEAAAKLIIGEEKSVKEFKKESLTKKQFAEILAGVLETYGVKINVLDLLICIQEEDKALMAAVTGVETIENAIKEWKTSKSDAISDMFGGLLIEYVAYQSAMQGLPTCEAIANQAEIPALAADHKTMTSAAKIPEIFGLYKDDLQINGYSILYMIEQAISAYNVGDFEQFGEKMGQIMHLANLPKANEPKKFVKKAAKPQADMRNLAEILQGFFSGVGIVDMQFMDVLVCVYEADQSALELYADLDMWKEAWEDKSLFEGLFAVVFLAAFGQSVQQQVVPACSAAFSKYDWSPLENVVSVIEHPINHLDVVGDDIVLNGQTLTQSLEVAYQAYVSGEWYAFGDNVGMALSHAVNSEKTMTIY